MIDIWISHSCDCYEYVLQKKKKPTKFNNISFVVCLNPRTTICMSLTLCKKCKEGNNLNLIVF
jgi:hypothetical protein